MKWEVLTGDCLAVMRDFAPGSFDAVITDPPYGVNYNPCGGDGAVPRRNFSRVVGDDKAFDPAPFLSFPTVVLFGANHYADRLPASSEWIVWDKRCGMASSDMADCEFVWTNRGGPARIFRHLWVGMIRASENGERKLHPTQKPLALMRWIVERYTEPGQRVLDPFCGSGTTGVACAKLGRDFVGIEISEEYAAIARRRIEAATRQGKLGL
mgnify:CR=1 FL=1